MIRGRLIGIALGTVLGASLAGVGAAAPAGAASLHPALTPSSGGSTLAFGHETVVDQQRITGEPSESISPASNSGGHHNIYVSTPFGFLTTASFIWKSEDGGYTDHLVPGQQPPLGKPDSCVGGGDSNIVNDTAGNLYFTDLQGLTDVSGAVSTDQGRTFSFTCNQANGTGVDRPWISTYKDPLTTGREYMTVDETEQCTVNCGLGQAGSNIVALTTATGTAAQKQVFTPLPAQQVEPDGIISGTVVDQSNGDLYLVHTGLTDSSGKITGGSDANANDNAVVVDRFPGGYSQTTPTPIPPTSISLCKPYNSTGPCTSETAFHAPLDSAGNSSVTVGQDFSPIAIDSAGNLYVTWAQAPVNSSGVIDGPSAIYMATSTDHGATWSPAIDVSGSIPSLQTNLFPWLAAGANGRVDVVWYGTPTLGNCSSSTGCGSGNINGVWNVYMAQTLDATTSSGPNPSPSFATTRVTEYSNHYGAICTFGISCTTGGDRGLLDFIQVQVAPNGAAEVVWADSANTNAQGGTSSALTAFARQVSGPGLYGGTVSGPTVYYNSAPGSPNDYYSANSTQTHGTENLDITSSSISQPNAAGDYVVKLQVANLASLSVPATLGGTDVVWLTRWELPTSNPTHTAQGHVLYAYMESDNGAAPTFEAGETTTTQVSNQAGTQQGFFLTYPGQHAVTGTYNPDGLITIDVPAADVGNPTKADMGLFSVTGITATQSQPSSSGSAVFNQIDASDPYDLTAGPPPVVPEAPFAIFLPLAALAVLGGAVGLRRRRRGRGGTRSAQAPAA
ncbi:MAG: hypothetical protein ACRDZQ_00165 [Acidimicrobiales bacterium]